MALYLASSLFMTGLIWFVQIVHYPLFDAVKDASGEYYRLHSARTGWVVVLPMLVQMSCAAWFALRPGDYDGGLMRLLFVTVVLVWIATFTLSVPQHSILSNGYNEQAVRSLVNTNWIRTMLWSAHAAGLLWVVMKELKKN